MKGTALIACHECDLLHKVSRIPVGTTARCHRCGSVLYQEKRDSLNRTLALTLASLFLYLVANTFPFLSFQMEGLATHTTLATGAYDLYRQGMWGLAGVVVLTAILAPGLQILGLLYVLLPIRLGGMARYAGPVFRFVRMLQPWSMMEVFMLGLLVSAVKLMKMADIIPGIALWSFALLIFVLAASITALDPRIVWDRIEYRERS